MRKKNRNFNDTRKFWDVPRTFLPVKHLRNHARLILVVSCLMLLLISFILINPATTFVRALEGRVNNSDVIVDKKDDIVEDVDVDEIDGDVDKVREIDDVEDAKKVENVGYADVDVDSDVKVEAESNVATLAASYVDSTVTLSLGSSTLSGEITPSGSNNGKAKLDVTATVRVQNSGGYSVYVGSSSSQLKHESNNSSYAIDSVSSATTYANLPLNRWGYSYNEGSTVKDSYMAMPATTQGATIYSDSNANIADTGNKTFTLSFAANIGGDKPVGKYANSVTVSVVSNPRKVAASNWAELTTMQEMTTAICSGATSGASKQLMDERDGKYYWVGKLTDGECWMTQNLDLDLSAGVALTSNMTDIGWDGSKYPTAATWAPGYDTATSVTSSTILASDAGTRSWSLGNFRIASPTVLTATCSKKSSVAECSLFTAYDTPTAANTSDADNAHYIVGNYYQWCTATAGCKNSSGQTGTSLLGESAVDSICPRGWRLPTPTNFYSLVTSFDRQTTKQKVVAFTSSPYYFVAGGDVYQDMNSMLSGAGSTGFYWSSVADNNTSVYAKFLDFSSNAIHSGPSLSGTYRYYGFSVRCIAR